MLHATKSSMESQLIPIPPRTEQEAIHEALSSVGESLGAERARVAQLRRVKAGRIQTWMRGER